MVKSNRIIKNWLKYVLCPNHSRLRRDFDNIIRCLSFVSYDEIKYKPKENLITESLYNILDFACYIAFPTQINAYAQYSYLK